MSTRDDRPTGLGLRSLYPLDSRRLLVASFGCAALAAIAGLAKAQTSVIGWGLCDGSQCTAPALPPGVTFVKLEAGMDYSAALLSDGTITHWSWCCDVPPPPAGLSYVDIAVSDTPARIFAILSDGTALGWGDSSDGNLDVPPLPAGLAYVQIAPGLRHTVALRSDGSVVAWGQNWSGQCDVPPPPPGRTYVEVAAGGEHSVARLSDGSVVAWGLNNWGQCNVTPPPASVVYVEIAAGIIESIARRSDGVIVQWGYDAHPVPPLPAGLSYVDVSSKLTHALARRSDGSAVGWGDNYYGACDVPPLPPGSVYMQVAPGGEHSIAMVGPAPACGSVSSYCWPPAPNSAGATGARFEVSGCPSLTANDLVFTVTGLPPHAFGLFNYGRSQRQVAFGNGSSCVTNHVQRVQPMIAADVSGILTFAVDLTRSPFAGSANPILPGSGRNFQLCYRDPTSPPALFNYSDAVHIVFDP
jgi:Regulator of chromosome condensation (RCC1) repeat